ncbi:MAG: DsrE family protein [Gammaproteobacteria bacterium]|nr:DsrE family protein [Gammaproteobacteria bacterium]
MEETMRIIKALLLAAFLLQAFLPAHAGDSPAKLGKAPANKVIFQVTDDDPQKWYLTLSNAKNVQQALGKENVQIEVLVWGPGLNMVVLETEMANEIDEAVARGVKIIACENTMIGRRLTRADMHPSISYVKTGVLYLMKRERQGWAYVRP